MSRPPSVVVVIPAHDERETISSVLGSVTSALRHARRRGHAGATGIQVVAHRCLDDTAVRARHRLLLERRSAVTVDNASHTIGQVRDRAALRGLARLPGRLDQRWVFSTDADSLVPRDWVVGVLSQARRHRATAVVGMTELEGFVGTDEALVRYQRLIDSKLVDGDELRQHDHVYGANLAIRADAYVAAGGFPHQPHGEDQGLVDLLLARGERVLRTREIVVATSGRQFGRAPHGLASVLRDLDDPSHVSPVRSWARRDETVKARSMTPTVKR